ncbi:unnamed protein product [Parnassius mnemosyne]|uniref:Uncharacterized protein n=1 Tax=Parnassius mnemosyne TaxID=213953 RepID=A0AAV1L690_9NEOP
MLPRVARWWTQMQEFDFSIEYMPGTSMPHVDALSRNPALPDEDLKFKDIFHVKEIDWLVTVQNPDTDVQRIIGILNSPNLNVLDIKNNYKLKNGKLFRKIAEGDKTRGACTKVIKVLMVFRTRGACTKVIKVLMVFRTRGACTKVIKVLMVFRTRGACTKVIKVLMVFRTRGACTKVIKCSNGVQDKRGLH